MLRCRLDVAATDGSNPLLVIEVIIFLGPCAAAAGFGATIAGEGSRRVRAECRDEREHYGDDDPHWWYL
jgi:hypothetical protein